LGESPKPLAATGGTLPSDGFSKTLVFQGPDAQNNAALRAVGSGNGFDGTGNNVNVIQVDTANQYIYVGGTFSSIGGSLNTSVAQYNMATSTWVDAGNSNVSFDGSNIFDMLLLERNGHLIVTGDMSNIGPSTVLNGLWAEFNPFTNAWTALPGTFPSGAGSQMTAILMNSQGTIIYLLLSQSLVIYTIATSIYVTAVTFSPQPSTKMCFDQTQANIYFCVNNGGTFLNVYNIVGNTSSVVSGGPTASISGISLLLRNSVYYIALVGTFTNVGPYVSLYNPTATTFTSILAQTTGFTATVAVRSSYVDYYNNWYVGSGQSPRLFCLPTNGTTWFSPAGGFTFGTIYSIFGTGNVSNGPSSAQTIYVGGTVRNTAINVYTFARLNMTNNVTSTYITNGFTTNNLQLKVKGSSANILWNNTLSSWIVTSSSNTLSY
jgi:hypothetical protein